jgi:hypothetical protein
MGQRVLDLSRLKRGRKALTKAYGTVMAQNAAVSLDRQGHKSPVSLTASGKLEEVFDLVWFPATDQMHRSFCDDKKAASEGAYGVAILIMEVVYGQSPVFQSAVRSDGDATGIDYWMAAIGDRKYVWVSRLEVSGINKGTASEVNTRLRVKANQSKRSDSSGLPAYIIIVEFSGPVTKLEIR